MFARLAAGLALAIPLLLLTVPGTSAHAEFVAASPAAETALAAAPEQVAVTFSQRVRRETTIVVTGPAGAVISGGTAVVDRIASTAMQPAGPGIYIVTWRSVSAEDGHEATGFYRFVVAGASAMIAPPALADAQPRAAFPGSVAPAPMAEVAPVRGPRAGAGFGADQSTSMSVFVGVAVLLCSAIGVACVRRRAADHHRSRPS